MQVIFTRAFRAEERINEVVSTRTALSWFCCVGCDWKWTGSGLIRGYRHARWYGTVEWFRILGSVNGYGLAIGLLAISLFTLGSPRQILNLGCRSPTVTRGLWLCQALQVELTLETNDEATYRTSTGWMRIDRMSSSRRQSDATKTEQDRNGTDWNLNVNVNLNGNGNGIGMGTGLKWIGDAKGL